MIRHLINCFVYTIIGIFAICCATYLRNVPNPSLLTVFFVFVFGVMLISFGARELARERVKR